MVITTLPDHQASGLARQIVEERLAACAQMQPAGESIYWWQGSIHTDREVTVVFKTSETVLAPLMSRIRSLHPYELPEILVFEALDGLREYRDWVHANTIYGDCNP